MKLLWDTFPKRWYFGLRGNTPSNFFSSTDEKVWSSMVGPGTRRNFDCGVSLRMLQIRNSIETSILWSRLRIQWNDCASSSIEELINGINSWKQPIKTCTSSFSLPMLIETPMETKRQIVKQPETTHFTHQQENRKENT